LKSVFVEEERAFASPTYNINIEPSVGQALMPELEDIPFQSEPSFEAKKKER
jgi:hypothetical protein